MNGLDCRFSVAPMLDWNESFVVSISSKAACARYVHREIKEKDNQRDRPEVNALQCQRRADVSGEGSRSESREFAKPIFAASSIPSLIRVVFCCFLGTAPAARRGIGRFRQPLCGLTRGLHSPPNSGGVQ